MKVYVIPVNELTENMKQDWLRIQRSNPSLIGPFFHPELFTCIGKYCPDIYVALIYKGNTVAGYLPFKKNKSSTTAETMRFCNYEAVICGPDQQWDMNSLLKNLGLKSMNFKAFVNFKNISSKIGNFQTIHSYRIDLNAGLEKYWDYLRSKQVKLKNLITQRRLLENNIGPLHFVANCSDIKVLHQLLLWKVNRFNNDPDWENLTKNVLEHIYQLKDPLFKGILSALYGGDKLLAANFSLRYQNSFAGIHASFNPDFSKYSVGTLQLHELIKEHQALEFDLFDLGPGEDRYKQEYSNTAVPVINGSFTITGIKERLKSIHWINQGLEPILKIKRKILK